MPAHPSDPSPEQWDASDSEEDGWGDAPQDESTESWDEPDVPLRRETSAQSHVTVIESGLSASREAARAESDAAADRLVRGGVEVHEISGKRPRRLKAEKPDIEKMPRKEAAMEQAKHERFDVEDREWSSARSVRAKWIIALGIAMPVLIALCLILMPRHRPAPGAESDGEDLVPQIPNFFQIKDEDLVELLERKGEARVLYERYVSAGTVEELLPLLRDATEVEPLVRAAGQQPRAPASWKLKETAVWSMRMQGALPYATLTGELPDFEMLTCYFLVRNGKLLIDWKATHGYSSSPFDRLTRGEGDASEVRGVIVPSNLYTNDFPESEYQCYQLTSPNGQQMLWSYVPLDSALGSSLERMFVGGQIADKQPGPVPVTVGLVRGESGGLPNQWLIEQLHHEQWISP